MRAAAALFVGLLLAFAPLIRAAESVAADTVYSEPLPRNWTVPVYPPDALKAGAEGRVFVEFVVDVEGRIVEPRIRENKKKPFDPRLGEAVLAAAKQWTFAPALNAGKPEPRAVGIAVGFFLKGRGGKPSVDLPFQLEIAPTRPAKEISVPDPVYPDETLERKLPGATEVGFRVSLEGRAEDITILYASDAVFVIPSLEAVRQWTFEPGRQGPLPVPTIKKSPMQFSYEGDQRRAADILTANGITGFTGGNLDKPPEVQVMYAPVYPRDRLVAGEGGEAEVEFVVGENGLTGSLQIMAATQPAFGAALAAAVAQWQFTPARHEGNRAAVTLRVRHIFDPKKNEADARVVAALAAGLAGPRGLDAPLRPLWRVPPRYPAALRAEKAAGEAVVEFVIDRDGRCRLPRVVSATREEFGWAAATAITQWVFAPPLRGGQPVDVRVSIPMEFAAPAD